MPYPSTKLNPAAPSFPPTNMISTTKTVLPPTPPFEKSTQADDDDAVVRSFDTTNLPEWMLVDENEKLRVAAVSLAKTSTRDEWIERLQEFTNLLAPGFNLSSSASVESGPADDVAWKPLAVREMPPALQPDLTTHGVTFSSDFIGDELQGDEWSPGFYFIQPDKRRADIKITAYWILDSELEPYLPKMPGEHGAKLTPFFNSTLSEPGKAPTEEDYMNAPTFIAKNHKFEYKYFGNYSQTRFSDKLDYERMIDGTVPPFVLDVWAKALTQKDNQPWLRNALREHIWPKPTYCGPAPLASSSVTSGDEGSQTRKEETSKHERRVKRAIERYSEELEEWEQETNLKLSLLKEADIHRLFRAADSDMEVGLRLWWEYLQCTSYENGFYDKLVELKYSEKLQRGYKKRMQQRQGHGWTWHYVDKVLGSGHTTKVLELRPPPVKSAAIRHDSVMGRQQGGASPGRHESIVPQEESANENETLHFEKAAPATSTLKHTPADATTSSTLPPHLRGRNNSAKPQADIKSSTTAIKNHNSHISSTANDQTNPFQAGDLEAAKSMASSFTKAGDRGKHRANFPGQHSSAGPGAEREKNDLMDQGRARAERKAKEVSVRNDVAW